MTATLIFTLSFGLCAMLGLFLVANSILVFNSTRYMAVAPDVLWLDRRYTRFFPDFLKRLYDAGFTSPWPARPTAFAAWQFRIRAQKLLKDAFPNAKELVQLHLSLWAFVQLHREELQRIIRTQQVERARHILAESPNTETRGRMLAFLNRGKDAATPEPKALRSLAEPAATAVWFARLRAFDILLREHGYHISEQFCTLDRWEDADDAAILEELCPSPPHPPSYLRQESNG